MTEAEINLDRHIEKRDKIVSSIANLYLDSTVPIEKVHDSLMEIKKKLNFSLSVVFKSINRRKNER